MPENMGMRQPQTLKNERLEQSNDTRFHQQDVGMKKRVISTVTAGSGRLTGANGDFANFAVQDRILVEGDALMNGFYVVTGLDGVNQAYLTVDPPPAAAGPTSVTVRTR